MNSITKHVALLTRDRNWRYLEVRGGCEFSSDQGSTPTFYGHALRLSGDADELRAGVFQLGSAQPAQSTTERT